jgi:hypothetical protein
MDKGTEDNMTFVDRNRRTFAIFTTPFCSQKHDYDRRLYGKRLNRNLSDSPPQILKGKLNIS